MHVTAKVGLTIAGAGVGLFLIDKYTTPAGSTAGGAIYGTTGVLNPLKKMPLDPTVMFLVVGLGIFAWKKFVK